jgi:hypothetical protein
MSDASMPEPQTPAEAELGDALRSIHGVGEASHGSRSIDDLEPDVSGEGDADTGSDGGGTDTPAGE